MTGKIDELEKEAIDDRILKETFNELEKEFKDVDDEELSDAEYYWQENAIWFMRGIELAIQKTRAVLEQRKSD